MLRALTVAFLPIAVFVGAGACGGSSTDEGEAGHSSGGSAGKGGTASGAGQAGGSATSGASGSGGTTSSGGSSKGGAPTGGVATGGASGSAATGGVSGAPPTGGVGGSAGGGGRECETADDCMIFSDCCTCEAVPKGANVASCDRVCITDHCSAQQIDPTEVACSLGRCVIDRSCDQNQITCTSDPEPCPSGLVHSVNENGCYGACVPPSDCRAVTDCASCMDGDICVDAQVDPFSTHCVKPGDACEKGNYCECLGACESPGFECVEQADSVSCYCPAC